MSVNYDNHYAKHWVRYHGWLPAAQEYKQLSRKKSLKYFTLCAEEAIDVFMLELEGVLSRDKNKRLPDVIICESDERAAAKIFGLVRPPLKEAILVGALEDILTFQDTDETRTLSVDEDVKDRRLRRLLRTKELSTRIRKCFPFDIINFDPYGNLLNPAQGRNKLYKAFVEVFELQKSIGSFLMFVTTPIYQINEDLKSSFKRTFESNISSHVDIKRGLENTMGTSDYNAVPEEKRIAISFAKTMVLSVARDKGWGHEHHGIFLYDGPGGGKMLSSVIRFFKTDAVQSDDTIYVKDIIKIIEQMPKCYTVGQGRNNRDARRHLKAVIRFREESRREYKI